MSVPPEWIPAWGIVNEGWNKFSDLAVGAFNSASDLADQLSEFNITPVDTTVIFEPPPGTDLVYNRPAKPNEPDFTYDFVAIPDPLELQIPEAPDFPPAPDNALDRPNLDFTGEPLPGNFGTPVGAPNLDPVSVPDEPTLDFPEVPTLLEVTLPTPPALVEHEFQGVRPTAPGEDDIPDVSINFQEEEYSSQLLDDTRAEVMRMMQDGTGMPAVVEQMIVDRFRTRNDREAKRFVQEAMDEAAARGFTLPQGHTFRRIEEARQTNQDKNYEANRDVFVQRRQEEIQNFQFAISQGIALENILINKHLNIMQRAFQLALETANLAYRKLDAMIAIYNAEIQGYITDAQVYDTLLRAEAQKLERYRLEIQAEALKGEINREKVAIYTAQLQALETRIRVYTAQLEGVRLLTERNNQEVQIYLGQLEGYRALIGAKRDEYGMWSEKIRAQLGKVQAYDAETRAFLAEVQAYDTTVRARTVKPNLELQIEELRTREYLANLDRTRADLTRQSTEVGAKTQIYGAKAGMFNAEGQMAQNETAARDRNFQTSLESRRAEAEVRRDGYRLAVEQLIRSATIYQGALDAAGRIKAQLSAGAMSAISLSAGTSNNVSWSYSKQLE